MKDYISLSKAEYELVMQALNHAQDHCESSMDEWRPYGGKYADVWRKARGKYRKLHAKLKAREGTE